MKDIYGLGEFLICIGCDRNPGDISVFLLCFGKKDAFRYLCTLPFYLLFVFIYWVFGIHYHSLKTRPIMFFIIFNALFRQYISVFILSFDIEKEVQLFYYFYYVCDNIY